MRGDRLQPVPGAADDGELLGYLHIKDVLETDEARRVRAPSTTSGSGRSRRSPPTTPLHDALETLQRRGAHMARVVDADGATLGLATLEDVIEELVGEIRDAAHLDERSDRAGSRGESVAVSTGG